MKKVILFMAGILASMMLNAQSRWSVIRGTERSV